jgi:hypothetical protein
MRGDWNSGGGGEVIRMMMQRSFLGVAAFAVAAVAVAAGGGCEKQVREARSTTAEATTVASVGGSSNAAPTRGEVFPTTQPVGDPTVASAHLPPSTDKAAVTQPAQAMLMIDGMATQFPPTKMRVKEKGGRVTAEIFSDLPASALRKYDGNELYFEMELQNAAGGRVDDAAWSFKSTSSGKVDSPNGVFLSGQQVHLQPDDVRVTFARHDDDKQLYARIQGRFRMYASDTPDAAAPFVGVGGEVAVDVVRTK